MPGLPFLFAVLAVLAASAAQPAAAQVSPQQAAEAVPAEVVEVVTGGGWSAGNAQGGYRAVLVMAGKGDSFALQVFLQWVSFAPDGGSPKTVSTVPVKEFNDRRVQNAFIALEADKDNEATLVISSFDEKTKKESAIAVVATAPGKYALKK